MEKINMKLISEGTFEGLDIKSTFHAGRLGDEIFCVFREERKGEMLDPMTIRLTDETLKELLELEE